MRGGRASPRVVDEALTTLVRAPQRGRGLGGRMEAVFISGRGAVDDAALLIESHGPDARFEAAARACASRKAGNVQRFCHWRQIERVIATLTSDEVVGSLH